ncbi:hypothetical protein AB6A40_001678 [Gnathostoma spinigerum]|uniref:Uncharacterized protein n=1 Tax=Gnathostoma spinigerum TaxID=75299 RepID=A0ABD6E4Q3_9BILA
MNPVVKVLLIFWMAVNIQWIVAALLATHVAGLVMLNHMTIIRAYNNYIMCGVQNGHKIINNVDKGPLTAEEQAQYQRYLWEVDKWSAELRRRIEASFPWNGPDRNKFPWNPHGEGSPGYGNPFWPFAPPPGFNERMRYPSGYFDDFYRNKRSVEPSTSSKSAQYNHRRRIRTTKPPSTYYDPYDDYYARNVGYGTGRVVPPRFPDPPPFCNY